MIEDTLAALIAEEFPHPFTPHQAEAVAALAAFVVSPEQQAAFVLRGYAGTGKTSLVGALVRTLKKLHREVVLMAPTGRAAKVSSAHPEEAAYTLHKTIYRQQTFKGEGTRFSLGYNKLQHALFVVDEASMLGLGSGSIFGTGLLIDDLVHYVYDGEGCKLLFVGDTAQLPPVGETESPALSADFLRSMGLRVFEASLTEVVRQSSASGVLVGATRLRQMLAEGFEGWPRIGGVQEGDSQPPGEPVPEVRFLPGSELIEALVSAYADCGTKDTIVVTRSNKRANVYNAGIRARIFDREDILTRGDIVMAVKNNYYWTTLANRQNANTVEDGNALPQVAGSASMAFIANGDTAEVLRLRIFH